MVFPINSDKIILNLHAPLYSGLEIIAELAGVRARLRALEQTHASLLSQKQKPPDAKVK